MEEGGSPKYTIFNQTYLRIRFRRCYRGLFSFLGYSLPPIPPRSHPNLAVPEAIHFRTQM
jgi:hypothetical protein